MPRFRASAYIVAQTGHHPGSHVTRTVALWMLVSGIGAASDRLNSQRSPGCFVKATGTGDCPTNVTTRRTVCGTFCALTPASQVVR